MTGEPRISGVIVNWNGAEHLRACLPTLASQSFQALEVIVVDNHSSDDSAEVAPGFHPPWGALRGKNRGANPPPLCRKDGERPPQFHSPPHIPCPLLLVTKKYAQPPRPPQHS